MNNIFMKKASIAILGCVVVLLAFCGCNSEREYYDDINITLQDASEKLIIKEWSFLQGSGIEVYYQRGDDEPLLLGKATGGDDGFCPFKEGLYEITQDSRSVTVKWSFNPSDTDMSNWRSKTLNCQRNLDGNSTIKFIVSIYHQYKLDQNSPTQRCCVGPSLIRETTDGRTTQ